MSRLAWDALPLGCRGHAQLNPKLALNRPRDPLARLQMGRLVPDAVLKPTSVRVPVDAKSSSVDELDDWLSRSIDHNGHVTIAGGNHSLNIKMLGLGHGLATVFDAQPRAARDVA